MGVELKEGDAAPDFDLATDAGGRVSLSGLGGRKLVLYFYPKDDTSGCTREAIDFSDLAEEFRSAGAEVVGMSPDSATSHDRFKAKHGVSIVLAADPEKTTLQAYGVWVEKSMYGRKYMGVERTTFLIDRGGIIRRIWRKVSVPDHAREVLEAVRSLAETDPHANGD